MKTIAAAGVAAAVTVGTVNDKAGYTLALAACGFALTLRMGRPGARPGPALTVAPAALTRGSAA